MAMDSLTLHPDTRAAVLAAGGIPALVCVLAAAGCDRDLDLSPEAVWAAASALSRLVAAPPGGASAEVQAAKQAAVAAGAPAALVGMVRGGDADMALPALKAMSRLLKGSSDDVCAAAAEVGAIEAVAAWLSSGAAAMQRKCWLT